MLRHEVGDLNFWRGIRQYYSLYKNSNALTSDFVRVMEGVSGKDLTSFFNQWIYKGGHPKINGTWHYDADSKNLTIELNQEQVGALFKIPLEIGIGKGPSQEVKTVVFDKKTQSLKFELPSKPTQIELDPNTWLLFEGEIHEK
jgi:aminopeptidase N